LSALPWSSTRTLARLILTGSLSFSVVDRPPLRDRPEGRRVEVVELVSPLTPAPDQAGRLEHVEVLRDGLSRQPKTVLHRQPRAELEQGLPVSVVELIENRPPGGGRKRMKDVTDGTIIGK
jgi:hypothetical protein